MEVHKGGGGGQLCNIQFRKFTLQRTFVTTTNNVERHKYSANIISICNNVTITLQFSSYILYSNIFQCKSIFVLNIKSFSIHDYNLPSLPNTLDTFLCFLVSAVIKCVHVSKKGKKNNKGYETRFSSSCRTHKEQWDTYVATHIENQFPRRQRNEIGRSKRGEFADVFLVTARGWRSL